jgi:predicted dehydrogenase
MSRDGMNYAPDMSGMKAVVEPGEFVFAASHFDHGHIYGQISGLTRAGGILKAIYEPDASRIKSVREQNPNAKVVSDFQEILDDPEIKLVTSAAIPNQRCGIGLDVMDSGKDYLTDKAPFTTLDQLTSARAKVKETGRKYMVCYSERLSNEAAWHAGEMIRDGAIGDVLQVLNLAPHNLAPETRPDWFFKKECYGGILTDIGSHQFEQFLYYANARDAEITFARVENFANPETPELEDFGEACLKLDTGASAYSRIDWFNPAASKTWGDGRTFAMGTKGYIEIRKNIDVARGGGNKILLVDDHQDVEIDCTGKVGFPYFGMLILDILNGTENAMTQEHAFAAAELSLKAQQIADAVRV